MISIVSVDDVGFILLPSFSSPKLPFTEGRKGVPARRFLLDCQASGEICGRRNESKTLMGVMVTNLLSC